VTEETQTPDAEAKADAAQVTTDQGPTEKALERPITTQDELDRVLRDRLTRERQKYQGYDEYREKAERYDEIADAAKTSEEKLQEQLADRERELEQLRSSHRQALVSSAIAQSASKLGVVDTDAAIKLIDQDALEFDDSGNPKNIEQLVQGLVQDKPYLAPKSPAGSFDGGVRTPAPQTTDDPKTALGLGLLQHLEASRE
jgi:hypothetical protein